MAITAEELQVKITAKFNELSTGLDGAKTVINNFNTEIKDSFNQVENSLRRADGTMSGILNNWIVQMGLLAAAWGAMDFFGSQVAAGVQFNSTLEQSRLGIASLITAQADLKDATGRTLTGTEALAAATGLADDQMQKLRIAGLQTAATTQQLAQAFQQAIGAGLSAGLTLDQIRQVTIQITQAAGALGVPMDQLNQEVTSILSGQIDMNSRVAKALGLTNALVKSWKEQGTLADELNKRMSAFTVAGAEIAKTWEATKSNVQEARDAIAGMITSGYMDQLKSGLSDALGGMFDTKTATVSQDLQGIINLLQGAFTSAGHSAAETIRDMVQGTKDLSAWIDRNRGNIEVFHQDLNNTAGAIREIVVAAAEANPLFEAWKESGLTLKDVFATISLTIADIADRIHYVAQIMQGGFGSTFTALSGYGPPMAHTHYDDTMQALLTPSGRGAYASQYAMANQRYNLPPGLVEAVAGVESSHNPFAVSPKGATGLMQLMPGTAGQYGVTDLKDASKNIDAGAHYLADLLKMFGGDLQKALMAYNAGPGNIQKGIIPDESKAYAAKVMGSMGLSAPSSAPTITPHPAAPDEAAAKKAAKAAEQLADEQRKKEIADIQASTAEFERNLQLRRASIEAVYRTGEMDAATYYREIGALDQEQTTRAIADLEKQKAVFERKLSTEKAGTKDYVATQREILGVENQIMAARSKAAVDSIRLSMQQAVAQEQLARQMRQIQSQSNISRIEGEREMYRAIASMGGISYQQQLQAERNFENRIYQEQMQALRNEQRFLQQGTAEYQRNLAAQEQLERRHNARLVQIRAQGFSQAKQEWEGYFGIVGNAFSSSIQGMIMGMQTWQQAMSNILNAVLGSFIQFLVEMGVKWAAEKVAELILSHTVGASEAESNAAVAATAAAAALAPAGPEAAAAAAATTFAELQPFVGIAASAAGGYDIPAGINPLTQLHAREMVLPAKHADVIRRMADNPGAAGATKGGDTYHVSIHAVDARSFQQLLHDNGPAVVKVVNRQARNGNRVKA